jgi:hypothetical protein
MTMPRWPDSWKGPYWEPRDVWLGAYWTRERRWRESRERPFLEFVTVYVCLIPCFPVRLRWYRDVSKWAR